VCAVPGTEEGERPGTGAGGERCPPDSMPRRVHGEHARHRRPGTRPPRELRPAAILVGLLLIGVLGYSLAPLLYPPNIATWAAEAARLTAISSARTNLITALGGIGLFVTVAVQLRYSRINMQNSRIALHTQRVTERGHLTDRYAKAIEQLGHEKLAVRLGGIYGLGQFAEDSTNPGDQQTVVAVLSALIRDKLAGVGGSDPGRPDERRPEADVLAAVEVLAQLPPRDRVARAYFPGALYPQC
jgi:hypothetical protein